MQEWQGINKTDAAALAGRFGLACPVYQIIDAPVVSTVLCTTKLADLQVLGRRCQSQSGGHCLGRQSIARIWGWRVELSSSRFGWGLQTALFVIIYQFYHPKILWDFFPKKPGKLEDPTTLQLRICCAAVASETRKCLGRDASVLMVSSFHWHPMTAWKKKVNMSKWWRQWQGH